MKASFLLFWTNRARSVPSAKAVKALLHLSAQRFAESPKVCERDVPRRLITGRLLGIFPHTIINEAIARMA